MYSRVSPERWKEMTMPERLRNLTNTQESQTTGVSATQVSAFVVCPVGGLGMMSQLLMWQHVYQLAAEQARAVAAPSRLERALAFSAN